MSISWRSKVSPPQLTRSGLSSYMDTPCWPDMDGENKTVAMYGNSDSHYNNNVNTRLRDLARSLLPESGKGYAYRDITLSTGHRGRHILSQQFQNGLQKWDLIVFQRNSTEAITKRAATREYFTQSAITMAEIAHKENEKVVWFMTWASKNKPELTDKLEKACLAIAPRHTATWPLSASLLRAPLSSPRR